MNQEYICVNQLNLRHLRAIYDLKINSATAIVGIKYLKVENTK